MLQIPEQTVRRFDAALTAAEVAIPERWYYRKWLRYTWTSAGSAAGLPPSAGRLFAQAVAAKEGNAFVQLRSHGQAILRSCHLALVPTPRRLLDQKGRASAKVDHEPA